MKSKALVMILMSALLLMGACAKKKQETTSKTSSIEESKPIENQETPPPPPAEIAILTIPESTPLLVTLSDTLQTNENKVGDHVAANLANSIAVSGKTVFLQGASVDLVITKLVKGGTLKTPPEIAFTIKDITLPDGNRIPISASEIYQKGRSHTKREVGMIGGGAAAGAIVGGLLGKGKGAAIGAVAGAAAGTGAAAATGRQNLIYLPGESMKFTLTQPVTITESR